MNIIAMDPHKNRFAIATFWKERFVSVCTCDFEATAVYVASCPGYKLLIEDQYYYRNFRSVKTLIRAAAMVEGVFRYLYKKEAVYINPASWKAHFKLKKGDKAIDKIQTLGLQTETEDEACAVLIGIYYLESNIINVQGVRT